MPGPNIGRSKTLTLSMFSPREKQERALDRRAAAGRGGGAAARRPARGQARRRRAARRGVHAHPLQGRGALAVAVARRAVGGRRAAEEGGRRQGRAQACSARSTRASASWCATRSRRSTSCATSGARRDAARRRGAAAGERQRRARDRARARRHRCSTICSASSGSRSCSPSPTRWRPTRDRLKQLMAEYKKTHSAETKKEIERELRAARAQAGRAARRRRSGWPPSCPISSSTKRRWATTICRRSWTRCAR